MSANTPEPAPLLNDLPPVWPLVVEDMVGRDKMGREKYGRPLQPLNGRDQLVDAYQEVLDLAVYLRAEIEERRLRRERLQACFAFMRKDGHGLTLTQEQEILEALK